jgi:hypothetical protein
LINYFVKLRTFNPSTAGWNICYAHYLKINARNEPVFEYMLTPQDTCYLSAMKEGVTDFFLYYKNSEEKYVPVDLFGGNGLLF